MSRFFSFGCSFTHYLWPTWSDILRDNFDYYENWGRIGAGNHYIFNSVVECNAKHTLTDNDTVIIMWTNVLREDRYLQNDWKCTGNIFSQNFYDPTFIEKYITTRGCYVRDIAYIVAIDKLLSSVGCNYIFLSMVDMSNPHNYENQDFSEYIEDLLGLYSDTLEKIRPSVHSVLFNYDWTSRGKRDDYHPTPVEHLEYIEKVMPEFNISDSTLDWVNNYRYNPNSKYFEEYGREYRPKGRI